MVNLRSTVEQVEAGKYGHQGGMIRKNVTDTFFIDTKTKADILTRKRCIIS